MVARGFRVEFAPRLSRRERAVCGSREAKVRRLDLRYGARFGKRSLFSEIERLRTKSDLSDADSFLQLIKKQTRSWNRRVGLSDPGQEKSC